MLGASATFKTDQRKHIECAHSTGTLQWSTGNKIIYVKPACDNINMSYSLHKLNCLRTRSTDYIGLLQKRKGFSVIKICF